eukprot:TRINITY_DN776_c0_g2_i1.p1 TRINITY_DN776_c0_g2~~TRINITY_DN776_c0_g2_i1.p1  ORF type:complete len:335 (-),score=86.79 TRINITY_DN776_c0_g2_i1:305-1309(-)
MSQDSQDSIWFDGASSESDAAESEEETKSENEWLSNAKTEEKEESTQSPRFKFLSNSTKAQFVFCKFKGYPTWPVIQLTNDQQMFVGNSNVDKTKVCVHWVGWEKAPIQFEFVDPSRIVEKKPTYSKKQRRNKKIYKDWDLACGEWESLKDNAIDKLEISDNISSILKKEVSDSDLVMMTPQKNEINRKEYTTPNLRQSNVHVDENGGELRVGDEINYMEVGLSHRDIRKVTVKVQAIFPNRQLNAIYVESEGSLKPLGKDTDIQLVSKDGEEDENNWIPLDNFTLIKGESERYRSIQADEVKRNKKLAQSIRKRLGSGSTSVDYSPKKRRRTC